MKRRLRSTIKCSIGDLSRNRGFEKPYDARKAKRVRFEDTGRDDAPAASSGECEAIQSSKCGVPKTSEYAYFKNMKSGAGRDRSHAQRVENDPKNSKINYLVRETSSAASASAKLKPSTEDLNFSVSREGAGQSDHNLFHSPRASKYDESDQIRRKELTKQIKKRSTLLSENVTPVGQSLFSSPLNKASEKAENQCSGKDIFSAKRQRLRQWAHSSFSEVEKLHLKGFDLVAFLLSRLYPKGNENNDSSKQDTVNSCKSLTVSKSNDLENRLDDNDIPKASSGRWSDIVLTERDKFIPGFPSNHLRENYLLNDFIDPDKNSKSHKYRSSLCLPFESFRYSGSSHLNDLDEFGSVIEHQRKPYRLLLEWDNEFGQDRLNSSIVDHGTERKLCTRFDNSWNVNSSLSSAYNLESLPNYRSKGCLMPDSGSEFNDVNCETGEPEQFPLALPYAPKCITLGEDKNVSYRDEDWLNKNVWDGKPLSKFWWNCISAPDNYPSVFHPLQFPENKNRLCSVSRLEEASVEEPFTPLCEGAFNRYFLPQSPLSTFINRPLSLDHVSEDSPDRELYFDDYGDELGYKKLLW